MTDVLLLATPDGGEMEIVNGRVTMDDTPHTATYLSLFGGNEDDSGIEADDLRQWWGNFTEDEPAAKYRSQTQYLLNALPVTSGNLRRIEDAMRADLNWMLSNGVMSSVEPAVRLTAPDRVELIVDAVTANGTQYQFRATAPWPGPRRQ